MTTELCHWGIKGMKWGIRRFRNPDGTLTEAGKKRYGQNEKRLNPSTASDDELNAAVRRMQLEKSYKQLYAELHPDKLKRIKKIVADIAESATKKIADKIISTAADKAFSKKDDEDKVTDTSEKDLSKIGDKELAARLKRLAAEEAYSKELDTKVKRTIEAGKGEVQEYLLEMEKKNPSDRYK